MYNLFILIILFFLSRAMPAQAYFDKKSGSEEIISILKKYKGKEVGFFSAERFNKEAENINLFLLKDKSSKRWGVLSCCIQGSNATNRCYLIKILSYIF